MISALIERHFAEAPNRIVVREMDGREYSLDQLRADVARIGAVGGAATGCW